MAAIEHLTLIASTVGAVGDVTGGSGDARHILVQNHGTAPAFVSYTSDGSTPGDPSLLGDDFSAVMAGRSRIFEVGPGTVKLKAISTATGPVSVERVNAEFLRNGRVS